MTELAKVGRISVATKLATTKSFVAHNRIRRVKVSAHDNVEQCCVTTEEAMHARQTRPGPRDILGQARTTSLGRAQ